MKGKSIQLYRGDFNKISNFDVKKTNKGCLLGQGVYLTDRKSVAESYRDKGNRTRNQSFVRVITATDRLQAKALCFDQYLEHQVYVEHRKMSDLKKNEFEKYQTDFNNGLENGTITMSNPSCLHRRNPEGKLLHQYKFIDTANLSGYLTSFVFPEPFFTSNVINFDAMEKDEGFLELLDDRVFWKNKGNVITSNAGGLTGYHEYMRIRKEYPKRRNIGLVPHDLDFKLLNQALQEFGIHGIEYNGGMRLGGGWNRHRAFNIFDSDFVNDHKVARTR